jgi:hypothetical protein
MKRHGVVSVLLLICSSFLLAQNPGAVTPKPPTPLEQSLLERNAAIAQAYMRKDVDFLKSAVMDDFVAIGSDGVPSGKADLLENMRETKIEEYRPYAISVVPVNENAAIVTYDCVVRMMVYDETPPRYQHISDLWVKQGDQWRLKFQQATPARF